MSDISTGDFEGWVRKADRRLRTVESGIMKSRVPRSTLSTSKPDPGSMQPGVMVFETDTDSVLVVNADQSDYKELPDTSDVGASIAAWLPPGSMVAFAGLSAPAGWLACDGSSQLRTAYPYLFAAIGTTYGSVDATHFTLPNLLGKIPAGYDPNQSEFNQIGKAGGEKYHQLTQSEMPSHTHAQNSHGHGVSDPGHGHGVSDGGHSHSVNDGGHSHGVNDPGHSHGTSASQVTTGGSNNLTSATGTAQKFNPDRQTNGSGTGISINGSGANISINGSGANISIQGSGTGIGIGGTTATNQNAGGDAGHNNLPPFLAVPWIIKT